MDKEKGQILLVVILTVVVVLTIGLSVASRTITNLKLSRQSAESQQAFQAAEAGLAQAVQQVGNGQSNTVNFKSNNSSFITNKSTVGNARSFILNAGQSVEQDVGVDVYLSTYPNYTAPFVTNNVVLYWGETGVQDNCTTSSGSGVVPAIEVFALTGTNINTPSALKYVFDPCGRAQGATGASGGGTIDNTSFNYSATIPFSAANPGIIMKVIPIYNSGKIGISSTVNLPAQGTIITSKGVSGQTTRVVNYYQSYPQIPDELFPYAIISQ